MTVQHLNAGTKSKRRKPKRSHFVEAANQGRKKILVADAHEETLIALEKILEDAGFQTATAWTASDALRLLASQRFHLLLLNEYLPDAGCEEVLKKCRRRWAELPSVVMLASAPEVTNTQSLAELGVREVVCKHAYNRILEAVARSMANDSN